MKFVVYREKLCSDYSFARIKKAPLGAFRWKIN